MGQLVPIFRTVLAFVQPLWSLIEREKHVAHAAPKALRVSKVAAVFELERFVGSVKPFWDSKWDSKIVGLSQRCVGRDCEITE
jgi:glycerol kinase